MIDAVDKLCKAITWAIWGLVFVVVTVLGGAAQAVEWLRSKCR